MPHAAAPDSAARHVAHGPRRRSSAAAVATRHENGDGRVLSAFAYLNPVLSTILLVMLGLADLTAQVVLGGCLIPSGIALSAAGTRKT